jgi:hypothetical protein
MAEQLSITKIPDSVKIAILKTTGDHHPNPATVDPKALMSDYNFSFADYANLTIRFDQIAIQYNPGADLSETDVENCITVQDCIDIVEKEAPAPYI